MCEGWPFSHHLATAHHDPEEHEVLKPPIDNKIIDLHRASCQCPELNAHQPFCDSFVHFMHAA